MPEKHRVVVVGGGYAGALAATRLASKAKGRAHVTLVDGDGRLVQRLRLHQVATSQVVAAPQLGWLCGKRVDQVHGWAESIDLEGGAVRVAAEDGARRHVPYDSLILATGSLVDTEAVAGAGPHAHTLSDTESARRLAGALERARENARVTVVGAGLTGIEAATEIAEARPDLDVAIVSEERFASAFSPGGREHLKAVFDRLGIGVVDGIEVGGLSAGALEPVSGRPIESELMVWCGGFRPRALAKESGLATGDGGSALVDRRMRSISHPEVLVVGDAAECPPLSNGARVRMSCQAGMPTGAHAADVLAASLRGAEEKEFDFGYIAWNISLGRRDGLIQWVDRSDQPKENVTRGRRAAFVKEQVTAAGAKSVRWSRRFPGAVRWLRSGSPTTAAATEPERDLRAPTSI